MYMCIMNRAFMHAIFKEQFGVMQLDDLEVDGCYGKNVTRELMIISNISVCLPLQVFLQIMREMFDKL